MSTQENKLTPNHAWLFAGGAVVAAVVATFGLKSVNWKVADAVYTLLFGGLALASTYLTSAKTAGVVGRFAAAGGVFAAFYFWFIKHAISTGGGFSLPKIPGLDKILSQGGTIIGAFFAVVIFLGVVITSLAGAIIGARLRAGKGYGLIPARR